MEKISLPWSVVKSGAGLVATATTELVSPPERSICRNAASSVLSNILGCITALDNLLLQIAEDLGPLRSGAVPKRLLFFKSVQITVSATAARGQ